VRRQSAIALLLATLSLFASLRVPAKPLASQDLGVVGPVWPIAEDDMLDALLAKLTERKAHGDVDQLQSDLTSQARGYAHEPPALDIPRATHASQRRFDPSIIVPYDLRDATGKLLYGAGTTVNPLEHMAFRETLVLIDGRDAQQIAWLKHRTLDANTKVILTGGSPTDLAEQLGRQVYFDQHRALVAKFHITAVPSTIAIDPAAPRSRLLIEEYDPDEARFHVP